jgi:N-methylhydantoinase A
MTSVVIPANPGILCAEGALASPLVTDLVATALTLLDADALPTLNGAGADLRRSIEAWFASERIEPERQEVTLSADCRYLGQNFELIIPLGGKSPHWADRLRFDEAVIEGLIDAFHKAHEHTYGYASPRERVQLVSLKARAVGLFRIPPLPVLAQRPPAEPIGRRRAMFALGHWEDTPVYRRDHLAPGQSLEGPAIIEQLDATALVYPGDRCAVDAWGNLLITLGAHAPEEDATR